MSMAIGLRSFGRTGLNLTQVGLGGEGVLRTYRRTAEAVSVIEEAASQGIAYFDSARAYAGSEGYYGKFWRKHPNLRGRIFQTSKSASRDKARAHADLVHSLAAMGLDYLDLWQIHDVRTWQDVEMIEMPGGALEAFIEAKDAGLVKHIGVTGHFDPKVLEHCVAQWPVDSVLIPVNPLETMPGGFLDIVHAAAEDKDIAIIGMKILGGSHYINKEAGITPEVLIRFALSQHIDVAIVGCSNPGEIAALARAGTEFREMSPEDERGLIDAFTPYAMDLAFYRSVWP
jgi:aryl-alcohol dehydrogenase-like predicted oxidoreductase